MKHSNNFFNVKRWYNSGMWDKERVYNAVGSGYISESEYKLITGEDYKLAFSRQIEKNHDTNRLCSL